MVSSTDRRPDGRAGSICFVANDFNYIVRNGGIGTYFWMNAHLLAARGWRVHVLYGSLYVEDEKAVVYVKERLAQAGIRFTTLDDHEPPPHLDLYLIDNWDHLTRSERRRAALEELHAAQHFDLIEFAEWGACALRTVQAKRAGLAFHDTQLLVKMHSSTAWNREGNHQWYHAIEDVRCDYLERYAFEQADIQASPSRYMFDYARSVHWDVRPDAVLLGNGYPDRPTQGTPSLETVNEVVFFGRLEPRKGLEIFLDACDQLPTNLRLTFVGKDTQLHNGQLASEFIPKRLDGRPLTFHLQFNQHQALEYLRGEGRLAVIPSLADNYPYTVVECATQGIPFVASAVGGIPEILSDPLARQHLLFSPTARDLARCLLAYLGATPGQRRHWHERVTACTDPDSFNDGIAESYRALLRPAAPHVPLSVQREPLVTVAVTHYNLGAYLPQTLASLATQTYRRLEVLVFDDGSTCADSRRIFEEQEKKYPQFRFVRQENGGSGKARNAALALARGELFVPVDADNLAAPHMIATFVRAMRTNPDAVALTCYYYAFEDGVDLADEDYLYCFNPVGGPHAMACFENVYGDTNGVFRTELFRALGGFEEDRACAGWEDWMTYVKLVNAGYRVGIVPEPLFYYRVREAGQLKQTSNGWAKEYRLTQQLLNKCFRGVAPEPVEQTTLWAMMVSFRHMVGFLRWQTQSLEEQNRALHERLASVRYRIVDKLHGGLRRVPFLMAGLKGTLRLGWRLLKRLRGLVRRQPPIPALPAPAVKAPPVMKKPTPKRAA